jgi:aminoglycoside phosphotransferase (APT) family kinase protein
VTADPIAMSDGPPPGLDLDALAAFLRAFQPGLISPPLGAGLITGGRSNLTYEVCDAAGRRFIVRRPPLGHVLATAHDMGREYRVITALQGTTIPVPRPWVLCTDAEVIGAPFFVMDKVPGIAYRQRSELEPVGKERTELICQYMITTLADLHALDPESVGLAGFGHPEGYLRRQVERWKGQLDQSRRRDLPGLEELYRRLAASVPAVSRAAIVHGDYRLDNLLIGAGDRITAVLDWEMSTLGDPLMDLAVLVAYAQEAVSSPYGNPDAASTAPGFLSPSELAETYARHGGWRSDSFGFYLGLAYFKITGILEGIHFRYTIGRTVGHGFDAVGQRVPWLIEAGLTALAN